LRSLCKAGLPDEKVFEYLALKVEKFEKKYFKNLERIKMVEQYKKELEEEERILEDMKKENTLKQKNENSLIKSKTNKTNQIK
jgi:hypothetical protein